MTPGAPTDEEIALCLEENLRLAEHEPGVTGIERRPHPYATSYPLEEVTALLDDGRTLRLILKDLTWARLLGDARRTKPRFLYEPRRCIDTYRCVLRGTGVGATYRGAFADDRNGRYWLLIDKVPGVELWQIGDVGVWQSVARWLARFHRRFGDQGEDVLRRNPHLLRYGPDLFRMWPARALDVVARQEDVADSHRRMTSLVAGYDEVVERLSAVPRSFVHGELYPSNVIVEDGDDGGAAVWPIDWEMAGVGPPLLDLAALTAGWEGEEQAMLVDAYLDELGPTRWFDSAGDVRALLECCRLHYALQWLGWSGDWSPPPEHAQDWVSVALTSGERLGL